MKETIICAAIRIGEKVWLGHRHGHALQAMQDEMLWEHTRKEITGMVKEQGFMTSLGRFVDRKEGQRIHIANGNASHDPGGYRGDELFSEDLY